MLEISFPVSGALGLGVVWDTVSGALGLEWCRINAIQAGHTVLTYTVECSQLL